MVAPPDVPPVPPEPPKATLAVAPPYKLAFKPAATENPPFFCNKTPKSISAPAPNSHFYKFIFR